MSAPGQEPSTTGFRRLLEKVSNKTDPKLKPYSAQATDDEVKQREATRARIEAMSAQDQHRVELDSQHRARNGAFSYGYGGSGGG